MSDHTPNGISLKCPAPSVGDNQRVTLAHGEGGRLMRSLILQRLIAPLGNDLLNQLGDATCVPKANSSLAIATDSFVVAPLFFPGGDIGSMSVFGTTNDLLVSGAKPMYLTLSLIIEEGFLFSDLDRIVDSIVRATQETQVQVVAGDTKVVGRGACDGLFINTTGIGEVVQPNPVGAAGLQEGDELIVSGPIGKHGIAVLCAREQLMLEPPPTSDSGSLARPVNLLREKLGGRVRAMRDATRGGVGAVLHEWAGASGQTLSVEEASLPVSSEVRGACEILGLDPIHIANEGTMLIAVQAGAAEEAVAALQTLPQCESAARIGVVSERQSAPVTIRRIVGPVQPLDEPSGAPLPRIC